MVSPEFALVETTRQGIRSSGLSPSRDMNTGGANYFFTRIHRYSDSASVGVLYFKKDMLRRMDAISSNHDACGKVVGDYVERHRATSIEQRKSWAKYGSNERIFKGSVTFLDNIDFIVVDDYDRERLLQIFTKHGISVLPDGRRVEDVIRTSSDWERRAK